MNIPVKPVLIGAGVLAGLYFVRHVGRTPVADPGIEVLARELAWIAALSQYGPLIAAAIHGASVMLAAVLLPLVVVRMLK